MTRYSAITPMLITVSGMVGSGKSTWTKQIVAELTSHGFSAERVSFRRRPAESASTRGAASGRDGPTRRTDATNTGRELRWKGFTPRTLGVVTSLGYLARALLFRARTWHCRHMLVLDRYFYDSFVHYGLATRRERIYVALLRLVIPKPDLAILLVATAATVAERRPMYAPDYVELVASAYDRLPGYFPSLVVITTDKESQTVHLADVLRPLIAREGRPASGSAHAKR